MLSRQRSITTRIIISLVTATTLMLGVAGTIYYQYEKNRLRTELRAGLVESTNQLAAGLSRPIWSYDDRQIDLITEGIMNARDIYGVVVNASGKIHVRMRDPRWRVTAADKEFPAGDLIVEEREITFAGKSIGRVKVFATPKFTEENLNEDLFIILSFIVIADLIMILSLYLIIWYIILKPLKAIEGYAVDVSSAGGAGAAAADMHFHGEMESLRVSLEKMVTQLERRYAEIQASAENLRESEERLNKAEEIAHLGSWELDIATNRLAWSDEAYRIFGLPPQGFVTTYQAFLDVVHPEDRAAVDTAYSGSLREGRDTYEVEHRVVQKFTGEIRYVHEKCEHIRDASGRIVRSIGMVHDITDRKRAEEALQELSRKNEDALRIAHMGHWEFDIATGMFTFNDPYYELHGTDVLAAGGYQMTADEFARKFVHPDDAHLVKEAVDAGMASEDPDFQFQIESRILRAGDQVRIVNVWFRIEKDARGITIKLYGVNQDITERRRAEEARQESEKRFRMLAEATFEGIALTEKGIIVDLNDRLSEMMGYEREALLGQPVMKLVAPESRELVEEALRAERQEPYEHNAQRSDGTIVPVEVRARSTKIGGRTLRVTSIRDMTQRKQMEAERDKLQAQILQAQKMEAIGTLAGGVAHDFNNMLGVILGHVELALKRTAEAQPLRVHLEEIYKAGRRSADLTGQLLAFARKQTIAPKVLEVNETVEGMLKMLRRLIGEDIDLAWMPGASLWPVKIDPAQIDQMLANLCVNARDAIAGVGKVTIETGNVTFDETYCADHPGFVPGAYVMLAVSDDGSGMDMEVIDHLFEPFFTTKGVGQGTGLGLATVYGIVKQNDGFINVYSEPGKGTTFKIYLRVYAGQTVPVPVERQDQMERNGTETILLVEDEQMLLDLGKTMLEGLGYRVFSAGTPGAAIKLAETQADAIHLLITDVVLPEMSGRELSERIKLIKPSVKCLFMSGYTANVIAHQGVLDEGVQFIQKPFSLKNIAAKVREVLGEK